MMKRIWVSTRSVRPSSFLKTALCASTDCSAARSSAVALSLVVIEFPLAASLNIAEVKQFQTKLFPYNLANQYHLLGFVTSFIPGRFVPGITIRISSVGHIYVALHNIRYAVNNPGIAFHLRRIRKRKNSGINESLPCLFPSGFRRGEWRQRIWERRRFSHPLEMNGRPLA